MFVSANQLSRGPEIRVGLWRHLAGISGTQLTAPSATKVLCVSVPPRFLFSPLHPPFLVPRFVFSSMEWASGNKHFITEWARHSGRGTKWGRRRSTQNTKDPVTFCCFSHFCPPPPFLPFSCFHPRFFSLESHFFKISHSLAWNS